MPYWSDYIFDTSGNVVPGALITVTAQDGSFPTLYTNALRTSAHSQPMTTNSVGFYAFYIAPGRYTISASASSTSQTKIVDLGLGGVADVTDFGAIGNGVSDDTAPIQAAVDSGLEVYFPSGSYLCNGVITIPSNSVLRGAGIDITTLLRNGSNLNGQGLFFADSGAPGNYVSNITISDMTLNGQVSTLGFAEWTHLISLSGAKDILIERVKLKGFRGDGILLGQAAPYITTMRHTVNATVQDCIFDGVNYDNRNGISVIDGNGIYIRRNTFRNCTKLTMPGPINIEPDTIDSILKNIDIDSNRIESTLGNGAIIVQLSFSLTDQMQGIKIRNNTITGMAQGGAVAIAVQTIEAALGGNTSMDIEITDNSVTNPASVVYPFRILGVRGLTISGNTFKNTYLGQLAVPTSTSVLVIDADIIGNMFDECGTIGVVGGYPTTLAIGAVDGMRIHRNTFDTPNNVSAIYFVGDGVTPAGANISIKDNEYIVGTVQTNTVSSASYTFSASTNFIEEELIRGGSLVSTFPGRGFSPVDDDGLVQTAARIYAGIGLPNNANGSNGDFFMRSDGTVAGNTVMYHKEGGSWVALTTT